MGCIERAEGASPARLTPSPAKLTGDNPATKL